MSLLILLLTSAWADEPDPASAEPEPAATAAPMAPDATAAPAEEGAAETPVPEPPAPELTLEEVWAQQDPAELLTQAIAFQDVGNRDAALARLMVLDEHTPSTAVTFQLGKTMELMEDYDGALLRYEAVLDEGDSEYRHNAAFRRIIVLEDTGRHAESLAAVRDLQDEGDWSESDAIILSLAQGISELSAGKTRKGVKRIESGLAQLVNPNQSTWMRARARAALVETMLTEAQELELRGNKKAARRLSQRSALMVGAEQQVIAIAHLGEPEYALAGLQLLGDAYIMLHDDMLAAPAPRRLSDDEVVIYQAEVEGRVKILSAKAKNYYGEGVKLATRVGWEGALTQTLAARHDAL